jgi:hypothetical protein
VDRCESDDVTTADVSNGHESDLSRGRGWPLALAAVAAAYTLVLLVFTARVGLGWDETVYVSQFTRGVPAADFSAPRARGMPLLVAPVTLLTTSMTAIRVYLSVLAGAGLFLAFRPWLRLRGGPVVTVAALLFAGSWLSIFYGNEAMPNLYIAYSAVAGIGLFAQAVLRPVAQPSSWKTLAGVVAAFAVASLVRPTDATWIALPLLLAGVIVRRWRRWDALLAVIGGMVVGWGQWIVEAYLNYGGLIARLRAAGAENETGLHFSLGQHLRALNGPLLCRPASTCGGYPLAEIVCFVAIPVLALLGVWAARSGAMLLALLAGVSLAGSYIFTVGYAAPRFLMPMYALLALPVAEGLAWLSRRDPRVVLRPVLALGIIGYFAVQGVTAYHETTASYRSRNLGVAVGQDLSRVGLRPPCLLYGRNAVAIGYLLRCSSAGATGTYRGATPPARVRAALARGAQVAVITNSSRIPAPYLVTWKRTKLPLPPGHIWYVYQPPS